MHCLSRCSNFNHFSIMHKDLSTELKSSLMYVVKMLSPPPAEPIINEIVSILNNPEKSNKEKYECCLRILKGNTKPNGRLDPSDESRHNVWNIPGIYFMRIGEFELAKSLYDEMRQCLLLRQGEDNRRYHKGTAYHNLGVAFLGLGQFLEAQRNITLAFIEDSLSFQDPTSAPAYTALRQIFAVSKDFLGELANLARRSNEKLRLDPSNIYSEMMNLESRQSLQAYEQTIFRPNKDTLRELLDSVERAQTNDEKKRSLESLSEELFKAVEGFTVLGPMRTTTGELDRIIRNENSSHPFLTGLGPHILVECKNWAERVGASHIRIFLDKLDEHRCEVGAMLARNGITGEGTDEAVGRIRSKYQQSGKVVMVLTKGDIERIVNCENLIQIMKEKVEDVKFGRLGITMTRVS